MKNILSITLIFSLFLSIGCKKEDDEPTDTPSATNNTVLNGLFWQFNHKFDGNKFDLNTGYSDDFGNDIQFTRATFYISQPKLYNDLNAEIPTENKYFIVHHDTETLFIDSVLNATNIDSLQFYIGVEDPTNHEDPSLREAGHPLEFQSPSMHWGWTQGYLFMVIEGGVDTDGDNILDENFAFHIGLDSYLKTIKSSTGLNISANNSSKNYINCDINYDLLFTGIDLSTDNSTHTMDNTTLADKFTANFNSAFDIK